MRFTHLLGAALIAAPVAGTAAQAPDAQIDRAIAAWAKVKTVKGTFEQTVSNALTGSSATVTGDYVQERPNRIAIRFHQPGKDAIVADGTALWVYLPSSTPGQVIKRPATDRSAVPIDFTGQFLVSPRSKYDITVLGAKTIDGRATHGFVLTPKAGTSAPFTRATVWVDDDDSFIRDFEENETSGVTRHIRITSIEPNAAVDRSAFTFTPPSGVRVVDQTKP